MNSIRPKACVSIVFQVKTAEWQLLCVLFFAVKSKKSQTIFVGFCVVLVMWHITTGFWSNKAANASVITWKENDLAIIARELISFTAWFWTHRAGNAFSVCFDAASNAVFSSEQSCLMDVSRAALRQNDSSWDIFLLSNKTFCQSSLMRWFAVMFYLNWTYIYLWTYIS